MPFFFFFFFSVLQALVVIFLQPDSRIIGPSVLRTGNPQNRITSRQQISRTSPPPMILFNIHQLTCPLLLVLSPCLLLLTTQTPFPALFTFFGLAGHIGLLGKCSGTSYSNKAAFPVGFVLHLSLPPPLLLCTGVPDLPACWWRCCCCSHHSFEVDILPLLALLCLPMPPTLVLVLKLEAGDFRPLAPGFTGERLLSLNRFDEELECVRRVEVVVESESLLVLRLVGLLTSKNKPRGRPSAVSSL